jgi:hypothetical protein
VRREADKTSKEMRTAILQHAVMVSGGTCAFDAKGFCQIMSHYDLIPYEPPVLTCGPADDIPVLPPPAPLSEEAIRAALWEACDQKYFIAEARLCNLISVRKLKALLEKS